jgi:hypothetical protein
MALNKKKASAVGEFVQFAYLMFEDGGLTPTPNRGIDDRGYKLVYWLNATDVLWPIFQKVKRFYGYVAVSKTDPGDVILAIRGTEGVEEWALDFAAIPVPFTPAPAKGLVAKGFLSIFDTFEFVDNAGNSRSLQDTISALNASNPITALKIIGHSLGSALATMAAAELTFLKLSGIQDKVALWTFASPAVGLRKFATAFDSAISSATRIWNVLDVVPQLPPLPYIHVSGLGTPIFQTADQLAQLTPTPRCEHILPDYLWLLDSVTFPGDRRCVPHIAPTPQAIANARALRRAISSELAVSGAPKNTGRLTKRPALKKAKGNAKGTGSPRAKSKGTKRAR